MLKKSIMPIVIAIVILVTTETTAMNSFTFYPVVAQPSNGVNSSRTNMTSAMMASASLHLRAADQALMDGNSTGAMEQLSLAQLQISMLGMKDTGTLNETQAMKFMRWNH
jgi:nitrous oxidase accessory protein NosD